MSLYKPNTQIQHWVLILLLLIANSAIGQSYTSYFTGNATDTVTIPQGGSCLMGGATEDDNAMKWFLQRANGGDILVLRTSGSNGYNTYLYSTLGIPVHSVETIVCNNIAASSDPYVLQKIQQAEAIWFAGGDQWTYISSWRNTPVDSLINQGLQQRHIVIGGTSAGMAIQGKYYFSAQNGTVTTATALSNPYNNLVTVDSASFLYNNFLHDIITDTHFDNPDRRGRLITFLARIITDYNNPAKAIACDEYTAVCIDTNGIAKVFGGFPTYDDNAYFIQTNCELSNQIPENCSNGNPLTWNLGGQAIKVYQIKGNSTGTNTFNLNNWHDGVGGAWLHWSVNSGTFLEQAGSQINCNPLSIIDLKNNDEFNFYPNPVSENLIITSLIHNMSTLNISLLNITGQKIPIKIYHLSMNRIEIDLPEIKSGIYLLTIVKDGMTRYQGKIIKQ